jgi:sulfite reductase (NADPH) flavoprotein alpha-component
MRTSFSRLHVDRFARMADATQAPPFFHLPPLRQVWFQLHWLVGISAGTVLVLIGLSGAMLAFREELLDLLNPGVRSVQVAAGPVLTPAQIMAGQEGAGTRIASLTLDAEAGRAVRLGLAPAPGERRGASVFVNPYSGALQPPLQFDAAFEWVESLHRWLLLPREAGKMVLGTLALCLMGLAASGLYLRWPRRALDWRAWLCFDTGLKGRSFLWGLHSVAGTWVLLMYLILTASGLYWSFDVVRQTVDGWAGVPPRAMAAKKAPKAAQDSAAPDLTLAWQAFERQAGPWSTVTLRLPERAGQAVQFIWLAADAPHLRARSKMAILPLTGMLTQNAPYAAQSGGARALTTIYPLHMGTYFGLPGRIAMLLASLALPGFALTGWMLYLKRRKQQRATLAERIRMDAALVHGAPDNTKDTAPDTLLLAYASQTGQAERLALHSAQLLRSAGMDVRVASVARLDIAQLGQHGRILFIASSFGEGGPPDCAPRFASLLTQAAAAPGASSTLAASSYGVLALGERHYPQFCGFGHQLDRNLRKLGAHCLFPLIETEEGDSDALGRWSAALSTLSGAGELRMAAPQTPWQTWYLDRRVLLNAGSQGGELHEVQLRGPLDALWQPGALAEILPRQTPAAVQAFLLASALDGAIVVRQADGRRSLADALARSVLPPSGMPPPHGFGSEQACADALTPLAARRYSLASLPGDGTLQLLVRQVSHGSGMGIASGWLTAHLPPAGELALRLLPNPGFALESADLPCIYIGNGAGLAGLRAHLRARASLGLRRNWLLFGERERAFDNLCAAEIASWQADGFLDRLDRVFSRDQAGAGGEYVQDRLRTHADEVRAWIADGAVLHVCGSLDGMASGVDAVLADILGADALEQLSAAGRYRRDVY